MLHLNRQLLQWFLFVALLMVVLLVVSPTSAQTKNWSVDLSYDTQSLFVGTVWRWEDKAGPWPTKTSCERRLAIMKHNSTAIVLWMQQFNLRDVPMILTAECKPSH